MALGFLVLLLCQLVGEWLMVSLSLPVPGPVAGMLLLLAGLLMAGRVPDSLRRPAEGLVSHLALLFVPAGVGLMLFGDLLAAQWLTIALSLTGSTLITLALTGWLLQRLERSRHQAEKGRP